MQPSVSPGGKRPRVDLPDETQLLRIARDLENVNEGGLFHAEPLSDRTWRVKLRALPRTCRLAQDLHALSHVGAHGGQRLDEQVLIVDFPTSYPSGPPFVRVAQPRAGAEAPVQ